jgi:anti-sigma factor RsiW
MTHCPEADRAQDYLDDEMFPAERAAFEAHLATCALCAREVAVYRSVFAQLEALETWDPRPDLADRVLAEVLPAHAGRWGSVLAWGAGLSIASSCAALAAAVFLPVPRAWIAGLAAEGTHAAVGSVVFLLKSLNAGVLRAFESFGATAPVLARLGAFLHALAASAAQPVVAVTLWAAVLVGIALLWWMRPREDRAAQEDRHVGMLGF